MARDPRSQVLRVVAQEWTPATKALRAAAARVGRLLLAAGQGSRTWAPAMENALRGHFVASPSPLTAALVASIIDPHLLRCPSLAWGLFHWAAHRPGFAHTPLTYHALLKSLASSRPALVLPLLRLATSHHVPLPPHSLSLAIPPLLSRNHPIEALRLVQETPLPSYPHSILNSLLASLSANNFHVAARKLFDEMLHQDILFTSIGFGVLIRHACKCMDLLEVFCLVDEVRLKRTGSNINGSVVAVMIVDGLCRAGRPEHAWRTLGELRGRGWKPDFIAFRVVSEAFRAVGKVSEAGDVLKEKRKLGVAPRADDYCGFILSLVSEGRILEAKELGEAIVDGDFPIDDDVLNALISSVSGVVPDAAVMFCEYMIRKEKFPSLMMLRKLGLSLCKNGKVHKMENLLRDLSAKGYFTCLDDYNLMVSLLCKGGRVREGYDALKEMKKKGLSPDISLYNTLMEALCRESLVHPAKRLWDEMFANGCCPNSQTYNILICKLCETGETEGAESLFHHMMDKSMSPGDLMFASLIRALGEPKRFEAAVEVLQKSLKHGIVLSGPIISTLVVNLHKGGNIGVVSRIVCGLPINQQNVDTHKTLLKSLVDVGEVDTAINHIEWIRDKSSLNLQVVLKELLSSLSTSPKLDNVLQLLQTIHARGLVSENYPWLKMFKGS